MTQSLLTPEITFGWKPDVVGNGVCVNETKVAYVANKLLVVTNTQDQTQELQSLDSNSFVSTIALAPNRRSIAVAQYSATQKPFVDIFSIPFARQITVRAEIMEGMKISALSFSSDSKLLAAAFTNGLPGVIVWFLDKDKPRISAFYNLPREASPITDIQFHPQHSTSLVAVGNGRAFKFAYTSSEDDVNSGQTKATTFHYAGTLELSKTFVPAQQVVSACFSPSNTNILMGFANGDIAEETGKETKLISKGKGSQLVCVRSCAKGVVGIDSEHTVFTIYLNQQTLQFETARSYSLADARMFTEEKICPARTGVLPLSLFPTHIPRPWNVTFSQEESGPNSAAHSKPQSRAGSGIGDDQESLAMNAEIPPHLFSLFPTSQLSPHVFATVALSGGSSGGNGAGSLQAQPSGPNQSQNFLGVPGQGTAPSGGAGGPSATKALATHFNNLLTNHIEAFQSSLCPRYAATVSFAKDGEHFVVGGGGLGQLFLMSWTPTVQPPSLLLPSFGYSIILHSVSSQRTGIVVTASEDRSLRVFEVINRRTMELSLPLSDSVLGMDVHTSGFLVAIGYSDKLRLYNLLMDGVTLQRELNAKKSHLCVFSNGGHLLSAVHSNSTILIYPTYGSTDYRYRLQDHMGRVTGMCWSKSDVVLATCSAVGAVYLFRFDGANAQKKDIRRFSEHMSPKTNYTSICVSEDGGSVFVVGSEPADRSAQPQAATPQMARSNLNSPAMSSPSANVAVTGSDRTFFIREFQFEAEVETAVLAVQEACTLECSRIACTPKHLIVGTNEGIIRVYPLPLRRNSPGPNTSFDVSHQAGPIRSLSLLPQENQIAAGSADGTIVIYKLNTTDGSGGSSTTIPFRSDHVLAARSSLDDVTQQRNELHMQLKSITNKAEIEFQVERLEAEKKQRQLQDQCKTKEEEGERKIALKREELKVSRMRNEDLVKMTEKQEKEQFENYRQDLNEKVAVKVSHVGRLRKEKNEEDQLWRDNYAHIELRNEDELQNERNRLDAKLTESTVKAQKMMKRMEDEKKKADAESKQNREDGDQQIAQCREFYSQKIKQVENDIADFHGETQNGKKACEVIERDAEEYERKRLVQIDKIKEKQREIEAKLREKEQLRTQIGKQDGIIRDREDVVHKLKKENQDLEKHKYVKDYRIKELKMNMRPREEKIKEMKEEIGDLDTNLDKANKETMLLENTLETIRKDILRIQQNISSVRKEAVLQETKARSTEEAIAQVEGFVQDPPKLRAGMAALAENTGAVMKRIGIDGEITAEYKRQEQHLMQTQQQLKRQVNEENAQHTAQKLQLMEENTKLIEECRNLRRRLQNKSRELRTVREEKDTPSVHFRNRVAPAGVPPHIARQLETNDKEIKRLRARLAALKERTEEYGSEHRTHTPTGGFVGGAQAQDIMPGMAGFDVETE
ncbi:putative cilia- and flagella-associated protein 57 [Blattamonas nauphoetae]|uniref:Cilia- and flagella-associated protein 57 n=1 Tax=Blattamonas nauphoetae TaxID=2049346 RepID=A0ABQ9YCM6_9EUKA|nr:putative cilia- and flagella-associated protein 57 [Blattamonas nauphoetae]